MRIYKTRNTDENFDIFEKDELSFDFDFDDIDEDEDDEPSYMPPRRRAVNSKDNDKPAYDYIENNNITNEKPFSNVIGHDNQKKELLLVIDWFNKSNELKAKGVSIPKGVVLFGSPGNGKSLLIKEIIKCVNAPVFIFQGEKVNLVGGLIETFKKAKEKGHSIIVIDEIDLLIRDDRRLIRALQECLDGVESSDDILVLCATNNVRDIPQPLLRNGRLEKLIRIPNPNKNESLELFKKIYKEFNLELPLDLDEDELALSLNGINCVGIKAIVNDLVLRNGFDNITVEMIDESINNITDRVKDATPEENLEVAIHEAGHAIMARRYKEFFTVNKLHISGASGAFTAREVEEGFWPYDKVLADIKVAMAGVLAQKIVCGRGSRGCDEDLQDARRSAYNLLNIVGYSSCWETLPLCQPNNRMETAEKRRKMEIKIEKLLKCCEKDAIKYLKKHTFEIRELGKLLFEKKNLKSSEILAIIG